MRTIFILSLILFISCAIAHETCSSILATDPNQFLDGSQHSDCDYEASTPIGPPNVTEYEWDKKWIMMAHNYAVSTMPSLPFGAVLVDSRSNKLISIGSNMFNSDHPIFSQQVVSHAETVVITNATMTSLPDTWNATTGRRRPHPDWKFITLYGNIEACPMCSQGAIWRGLRRMVFGARASVLQQQRCWTQPSLTTYEVVDHSSHFATFAVVRGPYTELEDQIVKDFAYQCKAATGTPTPSPTPFTCTADFRILQQPPEWATGLNAALSITISDSSKLVLNGRPGYEITFSTKGNGQGTFFRINNSWGTGTIKTSVAKDNSYVSYTIPNASWNPQSPQSIGFTASTSLASPYNNICGLKINGVTCGLTSGSNAYVTC